MIREYGWDNRISKIKGRNSRLDEIQAAILNIKLKKLDTDNNKRRKIAEIYDQLNCYKFITPVRRENTDHVFHLYVCRLKNRDELLDFLKKRGIFAGIHYAIPIHLQPAYIDNLEQGSSMDITEQIASEIISLPMYPELPIKDALVIHNHIKDFLKKV